jgi:molecular chaperone GrpE
VAIGDGPRPDLGDTGAGAGGASAPGGGSDDEVVEETELDDDRIGSEVFDAELLDEDGHGGVTTEIIDGTSPELDAVALAQSERDEYLDSLRRLQAEFENYKKRVSKQQTDQVSRAAVSLVEKLLPVLDALDLAAEHLGDPDSTDGKALVAASGLLHGLLAKEGLERIDPSGEPFDPTAHEAVGRLPDDETIEVAADATDGPATGEPLVGRVMRPGYRWKGTVVRPAMVMVQG